MSAIEGVVAYQGWSLRGVPLYNNFGGLCCVFRHFELQLQCGAIYKEFYTL